MPMSIDLRRAAELAKLDIPEAELSAIETDFAALLNLAERLPPVPLAAFGAAEADAASAMPLRPDVVEASLPREALLSNAPETINGCFAVPRLMTNE